MPRIAATQIANGEYSPLLPVEIGIAGHKPFGYMAVVDTGADFTIVPAEILESEGISWSDLARFVIPNGSGAGGTFELRGCDGNLSWRGKVFSTHFAVGEPGKLPAFLLGRKDFFMAFRVNIRWYLKPPEFDVMNP